MSDWSRLVSEILLNAMWIGVLALGAAWLICRVTAASAQARGAICLAALAAAAALPVLQRIEWPRLEAQRPMEAWIEPSFATPPSAFEPAPAPAEPSTKSGLMIEAGPALEAMARLWALGALVGLAHLGFGVASAARLKHSSGPPAGDWAVRACRWESGRAQLRLSDDVEAPVAVGWLRPAVLFPSALAKRMNEVELDRLWLHEAAHLERRDDWQILVERACVALLWFHPAAWMLADRVAAERELACDELAAERSGSRKEYARTLTRLAGLRTARNAAPALSVAGVSTLSRRIEMLLEDRPRSSGRLGRAGLAVAAAACAAAAAAVLMMDPLIGLAQTAPAEPVSPARALPEAPAAPATPAPHAVPAPPALAVQAAPAPPKPAPTPKPSPMPAPAKPAARPKTPPLPADLHNDPEFQAEMRVFTEEMREMSAGLKEHLKMNMEPMQEEIRALTEKMRLNQEPFAEKMRELAREMAQLHMKHPLTEEQQRLIEEKSRAMAEQSAQLEAKMAGMNEKIAEIQARLEPKEEELRELQQKMSERVVAEIQKRIEEKMERFHQRRRQERQAERP